MANIMIRKQDGILTAYIAKKALESEITSIEFTEEDRWSGKITLDNGSGFYFEPLSALPSLPITIRTHRA